MPRSVAILLGACLLGGLGGCGRITRLLKPEGPVTTQIPEVPAQFRGAQGGGGNEVTRVTLDEPQDVTPERVDAIRTRERDLVWTDPDNPETELEGMEKAMAQAKSRGPWLASFTEASRASMREGKPLLIWFTDTQSSPLCQSLSAEVFAKDEFGKWAEEEVVRLRLDFNVKGESRGPEDSAMDDRVRKLGYLEKLKKRYKVLGLPTVLVVAPDGTVVGNYRGYQRTYGDFYFRRLREVAGTAKSHHEEWKKSMERRGYREWTDMKGRTVFAKLLQYKDGELILVEPDGKRLQAEEGNLSLVDQLWIEGEKAKRQ